MGIIRFALVSKFLCISLILSSCGSVENILITNSSNENVYCSIFLTLKKPQRDLKKLFIERMALDDDEIFFGESIKPLEKFKLEAAQLNKSRVITRHAKYLVVFFLDTNERGKILANPDAHVMDIQVKAIKNPSNKKDLEIEYIESVR